MSAAALGLSKPPLDFKADYHPGGVFKLAPHLSASDAQVGGCAAILYVKFYVKQMTDGCNVCNSSHLRFLWASLSLSNYLHVFHVSKTT